MPDAATEVTLMPFGVKLPTSTAVDGKIKNPFFNKAFYTYMEEYYLRYWVLFCVFHIGPLLNRCSAGAEVAIKIRKHCSNLDEGKKKVSPLYFLVSSCMYCVGRTHTDRCTQWTTTWRREWTWLIVRWLSSTKMLSGQSTPSLP